VYNALGAGNHCWVEKEQIMELRLKVDSEFMKNLQARLKTKNNREIVQNALAELDWVSEESEKERVILSSNKDGGEIHRLVLPVLKVKR